MESLSKSQIVAKFAEAIENGEKIDAEFIHKKTGKIIRLLVEVTEPETFIDASGIKWVRASSVI
jgi:hypothetical protein